MNAALIEAPIVGLGRSDRYGVLSVYPNGLGLGLPDRAVQVIDYLVDEVAVEVDVACRNGHTASTRMVENHLPDIARRRLPAGARVNDRCNDGSLQYASRFATTTTSWRNSCGSTGPTIGYSWRLRRNPLRERREGIRPNWKQLGIRRPPRAARCAVALVGATG